MNLLSLKGVTEYLESAFKTVEGLPCPVCQTGDQYIVIGSQFPGVPKIPGTVDEGCERESGDSEETAASLILNSFQTYCGWWRDAHFSGVEPVLYWRIRPQLSSYKPRGWSPRRFSIYMRLVLTDRPEVYATLDDWKNRSLDPKRRSIQDHYRRVGVVGV